MGNSFSSGPGSVVERREGGFIEIAFNLPRPCCAGIGSSIKAAWGDGGISFSYPILESFLPLLGFSGFEGCRRRAQRLVGYWVQEDAKVVRYRISWARKKIRKGKAADARNLSF